MKKTFLSLAAFLPVFWAWPARSESAFPVAGEVLHYSINWPSGLSLGEVTVRATRGGADPKAPDRWEFDFNLDAAIPGFQVSEHHHSTANNDLCSIEFDKDSVRGKKKAEDKTTFDSHQSTATRQTKNGGKSEISISSCAKDALTYLFALRQELRLGRLPPTQTVLFGAAYQVHVEFAGTQTVTIGEKQIEADRLTGTVKGTASEAAFEAFFTRDSARTPVLVRVPLSLGVFSMELMR